MKAYLSITKGAFMVGMAYRFGFLFSILGNVLYMSVAYYLWRSIYRESTTMHGLTFHETFLYVALGSSVFILLKNYAEWYIASDIREGTIIITLVKPVDYQLYNLFANLGFLFTNLAIISIPTIILLLVVFRVPIPTGPGLVFFPISLGLAFIISFTFDYLVGLIAFYTESIWGLSYMKEIIIAVFSGALVPLQFFPEGMQRILHWLPFQTMYHTPLMMVTRPDQGLGTLGQMLLVQIAWAVIMVAMARLFYNRAINVIRVSGG